MSEMSKKKHKINVGRVIFRSGLISWIIILLVWWLGSLQYDEYFLPSPKETLDGIVVLVNNGTLWADIAASAVRVIRGWLFAILLGVPLGLIAGSFRTMRWLVEPVLSFFRFVPAIALTTLFLMWFGVGDESKVALIIYASFFPIFINTIAGVASADSSLIEAASCMGANKIRIFFTVMVPSAVSNIFTGIRLGLGSSIICIVAAEMLVGSDGLGYLIQSSKLYYKTSWAFAGIVSLAILGFAADRILLLIGRKTLKHFGVK
jgi:NitT/TauT family transport system permease protein